MAELCRVLESAGLDKPRSYLQSGNVALHSDLEEGTVASRIEETLLSHGLRGADAMVRTVAELKSLTAQSPFVGFDSSEYYQLVAFMRGTPAVDEPPPFPLKGVTVLSGDSRTVFAVSPRAERMQPKPNPTLSTRWKLSSTVRFWNVVEAFTGFCNDCE